MALLYLIVLRLVHVLASVCWSGGVLIFFLFIEPTSHALGPAGMAFIQHMVEKRGYSIFMGITSILTVASGALLFWEDASGDWLAWMGTGPGLVFTLGSAVGLVVFSLGMFWVKPRAERAVALAGEIQAGGGVPSAAQGEELGRIGRELSSLGRIEFLLMALSLAAMAVARYWLV